MISEDVSEVREGDLVLKQGYSSPPGGGRCLGRKKHWDLSAGRQPAGEWRATVGHGLPTVEEVDNGKGGSRGCGQVHGSLAPKQRPLGSGYLQKEMGLPPASGFPVGLDSGSQTMRCEYTGHLQDPLSTPFPLDLFYCQLPAFTFSVENA